MNGVKRYLVFLVEFLTKFITTISGLQLNLPFNPVVPNPFVISMVFIPGLTMPLLNLYLDDEIIGGVNGITI